MLRTVSALMRNGRIELAEQISVPEGTKLLVTILPDEESQFWLAVGEKSVSAVWDNAEDDTYAQLLEK